MNTNVVIMETQEKAILLDSIQTTFTVLSYFLSTKNTARDEFTKAIYFKPYSLANKRGNKSAQ